MTENKPQGGHDKKDKDDDSKPKFNPKELVEVRNTKHIAYSTCTHITIYK